MEEVDDVAATDLPVVMDRLARGKEVRKWSMVVVDVVDADEDVVAVGREATRRPPRI